MNRIIRCKKDSESARGECRTGGSVYRTIRAGGSKFLQKQSGMTLIELVIAMTISSMLALLLYQTFSQSQKAGFTIDAMLDYEVAMPIMYNQLDKDISSIFVPEQVFRELASSYASDSAKASTDMKATADMEKEKEKEKKFKNIFVCSLKDKNVENLSFLSTHSLSLFNIVVPRSVRVVYRLVPTGNALFSLMRQESTTLDLALAKFQENKIREYELMRGLKEFSLELIVPEKAKSEEKDKKDQSQDKKYKSLHAWLPDETETAEKKPEALIPEFVVLKGRVVHELSHREYGFEWWFRVPVFEVVAARVEKIKKQAKEKKASTPGPKEPEKSGEPTKPGQPPENPNQPAKPTPPASPVLPPIEPILPGGV